MKTVFKWIKNFFEFIIALILGVVAIVFSPILLLTSLIVGTKDDVDYYDDYTSEMIE